MAGRFETLAVDGSPMRVYAAGEARSRPGVLVCMHAPGVDEFMQDICHRLSAAGFAALCPDLYHRQDAGEGLGPLQRMALLRDDEVLRDYDVAKVRLAAIAAPARQLVVGFCMGGRLAWLWAAHDADVRGAAIFYGGNAMQPWGDGPSPFERFAEIDCPMLGLFGNEDENPSPADVDRFVAAFEGLGKPFECARYDGAGHAFLNFMRPSHREAAAADAWAKCVAFLRKCSEVA